MVNKMCDVGPAVSCVHVAALRQRKLILQLRQLKTFQVRLNTVLEPTWKNALFTGISMTIQLGLPPRLRPQTPPLGVRLGRAGLEHGRRRGEKMGVYL